MRILQTLFITFFFICFIAWANSSTPEDKKETIQPETNTKVTSIDGAWELVWAKYNDTIAIPANNRQFKMFANGFFSLLAQDSSGKISYAGYGKFELQGTSYRETFLYHNNPDYIGGVDWQECELKGDTLYTKGFTKVLVGGKEVTADFPKIEEKRVRIK